MKHFKSIIIQGLPAGFILLFIASITEQAGITAYLNNIAVTIDITAWMMSTIAYNLMVGIIFAFVYNQISSGVKGDNALTKGLTFGFLIWLIASVPMLVTQILQNPSVFDFFRLEFVSSFVGYPLLGASIAVFGERYCK